ncbi:hypothetical protein [Clostridium sp. CTA-6]|nr:hypothetical protein [Clostridium botulinum]EKS4395701.1 hypothetical protein [Clostridium botulinum]
MNYISAEEFLKQPNEIQKVLINWWNDNLSEGFLYTYNSYKTCLMIFKQNENMNNVQGGIIPIFQLYQLIQFIEEKTKGKLEISFHYGSYRIWSHELDNNFICTGKYYFFDKLGKNLLQALWQVACKIAQEEADNQKQNIISTNKQGLPVIKGGGKTMREMYNEEYR